MKALNNYILSSDKLFGLILSEPFKIDLEDYNKILYKKRLFKKDIPNDFISLNNYGMHILAKNWGDKKGLKLLRASLRSNPDDKTVIDNYEAYYTYQNFFFICMKAYKEICEILLPKKDVFSVIIISLLIYLLDPQVCIRIYTIILPFLVLYIIAFIYTKKHFYQNPE